MISLRRMYLIQIVGYILFITSTVLIIYFATTNTIISRGPKTWVLLVAGSKSFFNYRHQADICHAYQVFLDCGIPKENIVVMMNDDIAYSPQNLYPGIIVNSPSGPNVYDGVVKDYTGGNVTTRNFFNVLLGKNDAVNGIGSGRVIESGPEDNIVINFVDHGGPGFLGLPDTLVHAYDLHVIVSHLAANKKFSKMLFLVEASYAGSMFNEVFEGMRNVFIISSSDPTEASHACYYNEERHVYLADVFSINWMKLLENHSFTEESLYSLYKKVRAKTSGSHVQDYGDLNVGAEKITQIIGKNSTLDKEYKPYPDPNENSAVNPLVPVAMIEKKLQSATDPDDQSSYKEQMQELFKNRSKIDAVMQKLVYEVVPMYDPKKVNQLQNTNSPVTKSNMRCCKAVMEEFSKHCYDLTIHWYARNVVYMLVNMCSVDWIKRDDIIKAIRSPICTELLPTASAII